jgi:hypothetical protein
MVKASGFDPLVFLGIKDLRGEGKKEVSDRLRDKISQYILIRIVEDLNPSQLKKIKDPKALFSYVSDKIPGFNTKVKQYLQDFKTEFYKNLKKS